MKMTTVAAGECACPDVAERAHAFLRAHQEMLHCRTDRLFGGLMAVQWLASFAAAFWIAPRTWEGMSSYPHPHLWTALFLGGAISLFPIALAFCFPGRVWTRQVIAVGQMLMSGLLIHLTGGRIETHFHVFGSLAFLAFYRDWRVLLTASVVTAADHGLRGWLWPQSMYGTSAIEPWHWLEHGAWVVFTDIFLLLSIAQSVREMKDIALRQAQQEAAEAGLQQAHAVLETRVAERTAQLGQAIAALEDDITERRRAETALSESEQRLARAQSIANLGYVEVDAQTQAVHWSDETFRLLGYAPQAFEPTSERFLRHVVPEDAGQLSRNLDALMSQGEGSQMEYRVVRADGRTRWMQGQGEAVRDAGGRPVRYIGTLLDITERVEAETKLADLHALLEQRLDRIVVLNYELAQAYDGTIEGWSKALDLRDHETEGHSQRVTEMTIKLAQAFGMSEEDLVQVRRGALLHDIGKMGVPDQVLLKPGPLTDEEWVVMRRHPVYAYEMLSEVDFVRPALEIPYCHHEKWDGTGYPRGLAGKNIPLAARLFAIVDVWDALRSDRPYRRAWPVEKTRTHIASLAGTHFDPQVVDVFLSRVAPAAERAEAQYAQAA